MTVVMRRGKVTQELLAAKPRFPRVHLP
jgi:hypothetical protein